MANNSNMIPIPGRLHSVATEGHVAGADEIYDDTQQKDQETINSELIQAVGTGGSVDSRIAVAKAEIIGDAATDYNTLGKLEDKIQAEVSRAEGAESALDGRVSPLETAVGTGGSVDERIAAEGALHYLKSETYNKTEVNGLVSTPHQEYVTVATYASLPASGSTDTIYRVSSYDGANSQVDDTVYSEYAWDGTQYVFLCVKSQIDEVFDITVYNSNTKYADLAAALGVDGANIPATLRRGGMSVKFVHTSDNKYVQYFCKSQSFTTNITDWEKTNLAEEVNELETEVYGQEWAKDTELTYVNQLSTELQVDIKKDRSFVFNLVRCDIGVTIYVKYKNASDFTSLDYISEGETKNIIAANDIVAIYVWGSGTSSDGTKYIVTVQGCVQKIDKLEESSSNLLRTVYDKEWSKDTTAIHLNEYYTKQEVDIKQGEDFSCTLVRANISSVVEVFATYTDNTSSVVGNLSVGDTFLATAQKDISYVFLYGGGVTSSTGSKFTVKRLGLVDKIEKNSDDNPFAGKNVVVLGDSHAQHRDEWMPKLCELTKMNYLSDLNAQLNIGNGVPSEYEMYFHPLRVQLQSLIDNRGATNIDVIIVENVHYRKIGNAKDYSFHPSQMLSFDTYNMTKAEEEAYWQSNFDLIVGSFPSSSQKADTLLKSTITTYTRVITFSSESVAAGLFTLSIDGHSFASDITSGMTLAQAIAEIYTWSFGDYCDWENISYDSTSITIRYKGSSSDPTINFSVDSGTTNISAAVSGTNTPSTSKIYRYLESAIDSDFLVKDKWHKMDNYFYNGYRTLKGFFEDININFPNAKIVVFSVPNYMFSDFDEHLNIGNFMETQQYVESTNISEQLLDIAKLYNAITINVEKECGISPFNWFNFYSANNVHPKTVGYERWAETIARFLI